MKNIKDFNGELPTIELTKGLNKDGKFKYSTKARTVLVDNTKEFLEERLGDVFYSSNGKMVIPVGIDKDTEKTIYQELTIRTSVDLEVKKATSKTEDVVIPNIFNK